MAWFSVLVFIKLVCVCSVYCTPSKTRITEGSLTCDIDHSMIGDPELMQLINRHPINGTGLKICSSDLTCCTAELEEKLLQRVSSQYQTLLRRHSQNLNHLLHITSHSLEGHVAELIRHSENKTQTVFLQVYQSMSVLATDSVSKMYASILRHATSRDPTAYDADVAILDFFQDVFPLVYHHIVNPHLRDYSHSYKRCLRQAWLEIRPFGDIPKQLATKVEETMSSVRIFLQSLRVGSDALNKTGVLFTTQMHPRCREELVRMSMCPWCKNLRVRPCSGYCLNVMRGCLTHFSSVLDLPWSGFVDALEQLLQRQVSMGSSPSTIQLLASLEDVVRSLDVKTSEAIMKAMMEGTRLEERTKKVCGAPSWSDDDSQPSPPEVVSSSEILEPARVKVTPHTAGKRFSEKLKESERAVAAQLDHFLQSVRKSRSHFGSMAESLCSDDSFAETRDTADCWNGHRVGEYTKTVVAAGLNAQKYNPELPLTDELPDEDVRDISDSLRNMRQMMMRLLTRQPESDSYMRDEEGSGDGGGVRYPGEVDDDEDGWGKNEGSGSGEQPVEGGYTEYPNVGGQDKGDRKIGGTSGPSSASSHCGAALWLIFLLCGLHYTHLHGL